MNFTGAICFFVSDIRSLLVETLKLSLRVRHYIPVVRVTPEKISKVFSLNDTIQLYGNIGASILTMNLAQRF
jgi:hypothetical protein